MITVTLYMKALALILHVAPAFFFLVNMKVYFINDNAVNNYIQKKKSQTCGHYDIKTPSATRELMIYNK